MHYSKAIFNYQGAATRLLGAMPGTLIWHSTTNRLYWQVFVQKSTFKMPSLPLIRGAQGAFCPLPLLTQQKCLDGSFLLFNGDEDVRLTTDVQWEIVVVIRLWLLRCGPGGWVRGGGNP